MEILDLIKNVPIIKFGYKSSEIYSLLEQFNITWSIKIKPVYWMIKSAIESGHLTKDKIILEASSWNTAIWLAYLSSFFGYRTILVIPKSTAEFKKNIIKFYGWELIETDGNTDDSIKYRDEVYAKNKDKYFLIDQFNNFWNFESHYHITGPYIYEKLGKIDFFAAGLWTSWTILWAWMYLKEKIPNLKIIAINPIWKLEWLRNYKESPVKWAFYEKYNYIIDEVVDVSFGNDSIKWIQDYLESGYFVWPSSWAILSWTKNFLKDKKWLKWAVIAPDWWNFYAKDLIQYIK